VKELGVATWMWLGGRDSNPDNLLQRQMSYRWTTSQYQTRAAVG
jgi:hypothetical protein